MRRARRRAQALIADHRAAGRPLDLAALEADLLADDEDETTLVVGHGTYGGTGWALFRSKEGGLNFTQLAFMPGKLDFEH